MIKKMSTKKLNYNYDFYSTSNVRDLIFHVQEHRYTIPKILKLLKIRFRIIGFTNSSIKRNTRNIILVM